MSCESRRSVGARTVSGRSCIATPTQSPIATLLVAESPDSARMASTGSRILRTVELFEIALTAPTPA